MSKMIELLAADGHRFGAYKVDASTTRAIGALVVVQEIFGVNGHMRHVAEYFAKAGYDVIVPALFDRAEPRIELGYTQEDAARGMALRAAVKPADTLADLAAAAVSLGDRPKGIVGYCWGGSLAWIGATETDLFAAASGWYGGMIVKTKDVKPRCPVQLHFGEEDKSIPLADIAAIRKAQPGLDIYTYPGAGHGFGCEVRPSFNPEAYALAQQRTLAFFGKHLGA